MTCPSSVELSVTGTLNGTQFSAQGTLTVDCDAGTKSGTISSQPPSSGSLPITNTALHSTGRCFVGARHLGKRRFVGPLELLGREFVSLRVTTVAKHGAVSVAERALLTQNVLRCELTTVGELRLPALRGMGPLREVITVSGPNTMVGQGRYSLRTAGGRRILVRYTHFYRSLKPHRSLSRLRGRRFVLRANISTRVRGRTTKYHSRSTIRPL